MPEDGLEALADFFEFCVSTPYDSEKSKYWPMDELMPYLQTGIDALKSGKNADDAVVAMEQAMVTPSVNQEPEVTASGTDSLLSDSAYIQVSDYIGSLFEYFFTSRTRRYIPGKSKYSAETAGYCP